MNLKLIQLPYIRCIPRALRCRGFVYRSEDLNNTWHSINYTQAQHFSSVYQRHLFNETPSRTKELILIRSKSNQYFNIQNLSENIKHNKTCQQLKLKFVSVAVVVKNGLNINRKWVINGALIMSVITIFSISVTLKNIATTNDSGLMDRKFKELRRM